MMDSIRYMVGGRSATEGVDDARMDGDALVRELVGRAAAGDVEAFGEIYTAHLDRIYRYVWYQVRNRTTAEDLTEEIFLKAWKGIGKFKWQGQRFSSWLYRIARNHVIDYFRTNRQHEPLMVELPAGDVEPEQEAEEQELRIELLEAISSLPEQQKQVIRLKFIEGLDNHEISAIMQKSQGAIRIMQMRALASLRRMLEEEVRECEYSYQTP